MIALFIAFALVFLLTLLAAPTLGSGWFWDLGNGLGFAAFAGLLYLTASGRLLRDLRAHRLIGQSILLVVLAHVLWFLLGDAAVVAFIEPGAPLYMWSGVAAAILLGVLVLARPLLERPRHGLLAVVVILASAGHILGSQFYLRTTYQAALFILLVAIACCGRVPVAGPGKTPRVTAAYYLGLCALFAALFGTIRNLAP